MAMPLDIRSPVAQADEIGFIDANPQIDTGFIDVNNYEPINPVLPDRTALERAQKAVYGLNYDDAKPTYDAIQSGTEHRARKDAAAMVDGRTAKLRQDMLIEYAKTKKGPLSPLEQDTIMNLSADYLTDPNVKAKPETIFETEYGHRVMSEALLRQDGKKSLTDEAMSLDSGQVMDRTQLGSVVVARREALQKVHEDFGATYADSSWWGYAGDVAKSFIPTYTYFTLRSALKQAPSDSLSLSGNLMDKAHYIWGQPDHAEASRIFQETLKDLGKSDMILAKKFADVVMGYPQGERALDDIFTLVDFGFGAQVAKGTLKVGAKVVGGTVASAGERAGAREAEKLVKEASEAGKGADLYQGKYTPAQAQNLKEMNESLIPRLEATIANPSVGSYDAAGVKHLQTQLDGLKKANASIDEFLKGKVVEPVTPPVLPGKPVVNPTPMETANNVLRDTAEAAVTPGKTEVPNLLAATGQTDAAAAVLSRRLAEDAGLAGTDPAFKGSELVKAAPLWLNPLKVFGNAVDLTTERARRLATELTKNAMRMSEALTEPMAVRRALDAVYTEVGFKEAFAAIKQNYKLPDDAILNVGNNVKYTGHLPASNMANTGEIVVAIGKHDGSLLPDYETAFYYAKHFGLDANVIKEAKDHAAINQMGNGYYLQVTKSVDETTPAFRSMLVQTAKESPVSWGTTLLKALRNPDDFITAFQRENRNVATHAQQAVAAHAESIGRSISKLSKDEYERVKTILTDNNYMPNKLNPSERGWYHETTAELDKAYAARFGHMPTEKETLAYFSQVQLNSLDWMFRNLGIYRDKARMGIENVRFNNTFIKDTGERVTTQTPWFDGKFVKEIPLKDRQHNAGIYIMDEQSQQGRFISKKKLTPADNEEINKKIAEGYQVVQVANPAAKPLSKAVGVEDTINFVLIKGPESQPLSWNQLPYKPGGHVDYRHPWYVKQPVVRRAGEGDELSHIYEGDRSIFAFNTEREAIQHTKNLETARQMLKGEVAGLGKFTARHLGIDEFEFRALFKQTVNEFGETVPARYNIDDAFHHVPAGKNVLDTNPQYGVGYQNFENTIRSPYNLFAEGVDKKFAGERNNPLWTLKQEQDELGTTFVRTNAKNLDPFQTISSAMANVIRQRGMRDYKIGAMENWIQEFHDLIKVGGGTAAENLAILRENPVYYLHNAKIDKTAVGSDLARASVAEAQQKAIINFVGTESELGKELGHFQNTLINMTYDAFGQKATDYIAEHSMPLLKDPAAYMRGIGFHTKLGLFNPVQFILQAQTLSHILAISPTNALPGFTSGMLMRKLALTGEESIINKFGELSAKTGGLSKDQFVDSYKWLRKSGLHRVEGEVSNMDDVLGDHGLFKSGVKSFLDKGAWFFKEGERAVRLSAWNASYLEWAKANPGKLLDTSSAAEVLARSNLMGMNMTRASNAAWQKGVWSVPAQFTAYQVRMAEQFFGNRLSTVEKLGMVVTNSALYGIPVGLGATFGAGQLPYYDDIRQAFLNRGINVSTTWMDSLMNGLPQAMLTAAGGPSVNIAQRYGPNGLSIWQDLFTGKKSPLDTIIGPSGTIMKDIFKSVYPVMSSFMDVAKTQGRSNSAWQVFGQDVLDSTKNISTVNNTVQGLIALTTSKLYSKNEVELVDVSASESLLKAFAGLNPQRLVDSFLKGDSVKTLQGAQNKMMPDFMKEMKRAVDAGMAGDHEGIAIYQARAGAIMDAAELMPQDRQKWLHAFFKEHGNLVDKIDQKFVNASQKFFKQRLEELIRQQEERKGKK